MGILSRFFSNPKNPDIDRIFAEVMETIKKDKLMVTVGLRIRRAASNCRDAIKDWIEGISSENRLETEMHVFCEFAYFFMYLSMRQAERHLSERQILKLRTSLGPQLSNFAIDAYCAEQPEDVQARMRDDFFVKLRLALIEYAECARFSTRESAEEQLLSLYATAASRVAGICYWRSRDELLRTIAEAVITEWTKMDLPSLLARLT